MPNKHILYKFMIISLNCMYRNCIFFLLFRHCIILLLFFSNNIGRDIILILNCLTASK